MKYAKNVNVPKNHKTSDPSLNLFLFPGPFPTFISPIAYAVQSN